MFFVAYSGSSMHPTLREPALLDVRPYDGRTPRVGDVVYFTVPAADQPFVHRIVRVTAAGFAMRGDNNDREDPFLLPAGSLQGRVVAAWRGQRRRRIAGGLAGRLMLPGLRCRRGIRRCAIRLLEPMSRFRPRGGLIARSLPAAWRPRVVAYRHGGQDRFHLLVSLRVVGRYDGHRRQWLIRRPYHFLVEKKSLPTPPEREGPPAPRTAGGTWS